MLHWLMLSAKEKLILQGYELIMKSVQTVIPQLWGVCFFICISNIFLICRIISRQFIAELRDQTHPPPPERGTERKAN